MIQPFHFQTLQSIYSLEKKINLSKIKYKSLNLIKLINDILTHFSMDQIIRYLSTWNWPKQGDLTREKLVQIASPIGAGVLP